jgi:hypothetical protein
MKTCKIHPDREAIYKGKLCRECYKIRYGASTKNKKKLEGARRRRDDLNLENLLKDARNGWTFPNLIKRYKSYSHTAIYKILKNHSIEIKPNLHSTTEAHKKAASSVGKIVDMLDWTCSIKPTHQKARMSL